MFKIIAVDLDDGMYAAVLQDVESELFYDAGCGNNEWTLTPLGNQWQASGRDNLFELPDTWGDALTDQYDIEAVSKAYYGCEKPDTEG